MWLYREQQASITWKYTGQWRKRLKRTIWLSTQYIKKFWNVQATVRPAHQRQRNNSCSQINVFHTLKKLIFQSQFSWAILIHVSAAGKLKRWIFRKTSWICQITSPIHPYQMLSCLRRGNKGEKLFVLSVENYNTNTTFKNTFWVKIVEKRTLQSQSRMTLMEK